MDFKLIENGNGGDFENKSRDLKIIEGFENMPYLAMFGGSIEQDTPQDREENVQYFDWFGNSLFLNETPELQFNSLTERTLNNVALNSFGRSQIEQAVNKDLEFMKEFADLTINVEIQSDDKVRIEILVDEPNNLQNKQFVFIWDATELELIDGKAGVFVPEPVTELFDDTFDDTFA